MKEIKYVNLIILVFVLNGKGSEDSKYDGEGIILQRVPENSHKESKIGLKKEIRMKAKYLSLEELSQYKEQIQSPPR